jgi:hypothetical protein
MSRGGEKRASTIAYTVSDPDEETAGARDRARSCPESRIVTYTRVPLGIRLYGSMFRHEKPWAFDTT